MRILRLGFLVSLVALTFTLACNSKKKKHHPSDKENIPTEENNEKSDDSNSNDDENDFSENNPGYCGYKFDLEEDDAVIANMEAELSRTWQSRTGGNIEKEGGVERTYYHGIKLDTSAKSYIELKIYYETVLTAFGTTENVTEVKESNATKYKKIYFSQPYKIDDDHNPRMIVMETEKASTRCFARGFEVKKEEKEDKLFTTSPIGSSSYGNGVKAKDISQFFSEQNLSWGYKIKK